MRKSILQKQLIKLGILGVLLPSISFAQSTVNIQEVEVSASRNDVSFEKAARSVIVISSEEIEKTPAKNLNELLEYVSNVDVRQRGQNGIQADISIRGSSFEQVLILVNGVKMTDPQTGHHAMNLPIDLLNIERIEILHGGAARIYGPGAFAGAINIITKTLESSQVNVQLISGEFGYQQLSLSATVVDSNHSHTISFLDQTSDGFIRNTDHQMQNIFWQSDFKIKKSQWKVNLGRNEKAFGAQNFYTARFPDQFEETSTQFAALIGEIQWKNLLIQPKASVRRHQDRFELFREGESYFRRLPQGGFANNFEDTIPWYNGHNYHQTHVYAAEVNLSYESKIGVSSLGVDFRREEILSNVLGKALENQKTVKGEDETAFYLKGDDRENKSVFLEHTYTSANWLVSTGALLNAHSDYKEGLYPGIDVAYQLTDEFRPYASVNKSFRFPTYTDLYYNLGGAIGSINLKPEESINYELGVKFQQKRNYGHLAVFRREGKNLIDWIRFSGSAITQAANLTNVTIDGLEFDYVLSQNPWLEELKFIDQIRFNYAYLNSADASKGFESNYVLDFLQHKADASIQFGILENLALNWNLSFQDRKGEYVNVEGNEKNYKAVILSDVKLMTRNKQLNLFIQVSNVFDQQFVDIGNIQNPGRWTNVGLNYRFTLK